jgi:hypothetical protein
MRADPSGLRMDKVRAPPGTLSAARRETGGPRRAWVSPRRTCRWRTGRWPASTRRGIGVVAGARRTRRTTRSSAVRVAWAASRSVLHSSRSPRASQSPASAAAARCASAIGACAGVRSASRWCSASFRASPTLVGGGSTVSPCPARAVIATWIVVWPAISRPASRSREASRSSHIAVLTVQSSSISGKVHSAGRRPPALRCAATASSSETREVTKARATVSPVPARVSTPTS